MILNAYTYVYVCGNKIYQLYQLRKERNKFIISTKNWYYFLSYKFREVFK